MQVFEAEALGQTISAEVARLGVGLDVGVYGGQRTHVGAVTLAEADGHCRTLLREGHRDDAVSERFAAAPAARFGVPVCVRCGIHYDGIGRAEIAAVLAACEALLEQALERAQDGEGI